MKKSIKQVTFFVTALLFVVGVSLTNNATAVVPGVNQRVSVSYDGGNANESSGSSPFMAPDGRSIVFGTAATNLVSGGNAAGKYIKYLDTGTLVRIDVSTAGTAADGPIYIKDVSTTGRYILFTALASNLIDGITVPTTSLQLYLRDTKNSTTVLVSKNADDVISNGTRMSPLGVSSDGRFIAFSTNASNLSPESTNGKPHLYMLDRSDNAITILDRRTDGVLGGTSTTWYPEGQMSCDGSLIAFQYSGKLIADEPDNGQVDVYLLDRRGDSDKLTNLTVSANSAGVSPTISCNGDFIGFGSGATNLDPTLTVTGYGDFLPYVYDRVNNAYHFIEVRSDGTASSAGLCGNMFTNPVAVPCVWPSDGGVAAFIASDSMLTGASGQQVYIRNFYTNTTELLSRSSSGSAGNAISGSVTISFDGKKASYMSSATNLVPNDTNNYADVFTSLTGY